MTEAEMLAISALVNGATGSQAVVLSFMCDKGILDRGELIEHLEQAYAKYSSSTKDPRNALSLQYLAMMLKGEIPLLN